MSVVAKNIYEIIYKAFIAYNKRTSNRYSSFYKNQTEVTKMLNDYKNEFAVEQK
jgi:hypothetical protein